MKWWTLRDGCFNMHSVAKHQKIEGGPFGENFFEEKSHNASQKLKGRLFLVSPGIVCYAEKKRGKSFLVQFARPNDSFWGHKIL